MSYITLIERELGGRQIAVNTRGAVTERLFKCDKTPYNAGLVTHLSMGAISCAPDIIIPAQIEAVVFL